jgi:hypothetical protein
MENKRRFKEKEEIWEQELGALRQELRLLE